MVRNSIDTGSRSHAASSTARVSDAGTETCGDRTNPGVKQIRPCRIRHRSVTAANPAESAKPSSANGVTPNQRGGSTATPIGKPSSVKRVPPEKASSKKSKIATRAQLGAASNGSTGCAPPRQRPVAIGGRRKAANGDVIDEGQKPSGRNHALANSGFLPAGQPRLRSRASWWGSWAP